MSHTPAASMPSSPQLKSTSKLGPPSASKTSPAKDASSTQTLRNQISRNLASPLNAQPTSPPQSRTTSPIRTHGTGPFPPQSPAQSRALRSRQNSQDVSNLSTQPPKTRSAPTSSQSSPSSATNRSQTAALLQARAANGTAQNDPKSSRTTRILIAPSDPTSPNTKASTPQSRDSPTPTPSTANSRKNSLHRAQDGLMVAAPSVTLQTSTPPTSAHPDSANANGADPLQQDQLSTAIKVHNARGPSGPKSTLETVIEGTPPTVSALSRALDNASSLAPSRKASMDRGPKSAKSLTDDSQDRSESEGNLSDRRGRKLEPASLGSLKARPGQLKGGAPPTPRTRQAENMRNMTVETETVSSIPHAAMSSDRGANRIDAGGSVRLESSYETIRPKKDRKKPVRKAQSVHNGTASSKADIFEARVASVVDEANSDDSDETFVYESNPPDAAAHRASRHHSRTPSTASLCSQSERKGQYGNVGQAHRVSGKRSMKFSNNPYMNGDSPPDGESGSIRAHQPRHISRFGRTMGSHTSLHGPDSPFTQANKIRVNVASSNTLLPGNTPKAPKTAPLPRGRGSSAQWSSKNDLLHNDYANDGSDDELLPLMGSGTVRTPRSARLPRRSGGRRSLERIYGYQQTSRLRRRSGCWILSCAAFVLLFLAMGAVSIMSNKAIYSVRVKGIDNVLASDQELMLDVLISAVNPNFVDIHVTDMDINVFAKSSHVSNPDNKDRSGKVVARRRSVSPGKGSIVHGAGRGGTPWQDPNGRWGDDHGDGLDSDTSTMLLGRVFEFDQSLVFEASPFRRREQRSMGELRLADPGNITEPDGSHRWGRVVQYPFQLIIRGVIKYQAPVTGRAESSAIYGSVVVHPEEGVDHDGFMRVEEGEKLAFE